jgi:hypothetical protein
MIGLHGSKGLNEAEGFDLGRPEALGEMGVFEVVGWEEGLRGGF